MKVGLQQFGWNGVTIGSGGIIFFTFFGAWALWRQNQKIWATASGESVSIPWIMYTTGLYLAIVIYGLSIKSIALMINGSLRIPLCVMILIGLWKFKGFNKKECSLLAGLSVALVGMSMTPIKDVFFFGFTLGSFVFIAMQPLEMWRNKSNGVFEIRVPLVMISSNLFWMTYGFAIHNWVIKSTTFIYFGILGTTIVLWYKYRMGNNIHAK